MGKDYEHKITFLLANKLIYCFRLGKFLEKTKVDTKKFATCNIMQKYCGMVSSNIIKIRKPKQKLLKVFWFFHYPLRALQMINISSISFYFHFAALKICF